MSYDTDHYARAAKVTPLASQTRSKAPGFVGPRGAPSVESSYPLFLSRGEGPYVFSDDDDSFTQPATKYLDCAGANAAVPLGHAWPPIVAAVSAAIARGSLLSLPTYDEAFVSQLFLEVCASWAEQVRWVRTGSEACHAAYRIAKRATGRGIVLIGDWAYHGWHEWAQAPFGDAGGLPGGLPRYEYGTYPPVGPIPTRLHGDIAAVFFEPHRWRRLPSELWLQSVRDWCTANGSLLVFDEMVYGLRWAKGGSVEYYGVTPDLACFGKALGNGVPVACVCGPERIMRSTPAAGVSGTYGGDSIGLAAAAAVLRAHQQEDLIAKIWQSGQALWDGYHAVAPQYPFGGTPVHWRLELPDDVMDRALILCAEAQILVARAANNASAAMPVDVAWTAGRTIAACVLQAVNELAKRTPEVAHA